MDKTMTSNTPSSVYSKFLEGYKECLKTKPSLPLRSYCRDNNLPYEKNLDWTNRQGVFVKELKGEVRSEEHKKGEAPGTFIQFRAQPRLNQGECTEGSQYNLSRYYQSKLTGMHSREPGFITVVVSYKKVALHV